MARPERNTVEYFPHFFSEGKKMFFIENKYGNNGYATWFKILEKLASTEFHYLNLNKEEELMFLSAKCKISEELLLAIINDLVKLGVFNSDLWKIKIIWCESFIESIVDVYERRKNKCITFDSLCIHLQSLGIHLCSKLPPRVNKKPQTKLNYTKLNKTIFQESVFFDVNKFKNAMPSDWNKEKLRYYYDAAIRYSDEGGRYSKWDVAVKSWAKKDELQGKIKFTTQVSEPQNIVSPIKFG